MAGLLQAHMQVAKGGLRFLVPTEAGFRWELLESLFRVAKKWQDFRKRCWGVWKKH